MPPFFSSPAHRRRQHRSVFHLPGQTRAYSALNLTFEVSAKAWAWINSTWSNLSRRTKATRTVILRLRKCRLPAATRLPRKSMCQMPMLLWCVVAALSHSVIWVGGLLLNMLTGFVCNLLIFARRIKWFRLTSRMPATGTGRSSTLRRTLGERALRDVLRSGTCSTIIIAILALWVKYWLRNASIESLLNRRMN